MDTFFRIEDIEFFHEKMKLDRSYSSKNDQNQIDGARISETIFIPTNQWAESVARKLGSDFLFEKDVHWQLGRAFKPYSWARFYLKQWGNIGIFFTIGVDADSQSLLIKIDFQRNRSDLADKISMFDKFLELQKVEKLYLSTDEIKEKSQESLVEKTCEYINKNINIYKKLYEMAEVKNNSAKILEYNSAKNPLNQILFGPPGTGKTYNSIKKAVEITNPTFSETQWKDIKEEFDRLVESGQVVFTTFHQSMSYEDFIEGIKPETTESGNVTYLVQDGIFKLLCNAAKTPNQSDFDKAYEKLKLELPENELITLKTPRGKEFAISLNSNDNLSLHTGQTKEKQGTLTKENIQKQIYGEEKFRGWEGYFRGVINYLENKFGYSTNPDVGTKNYVLIIDEINRGNVSQIFGELITLIEESKREGKDETLKVRLPYSKKEFSVPSNLFIIGTMNTADRSVEALDTALRRRFSFEEMPPKYDLEELSYTVTDGVKATDILAKINLRLEKLLDKDHLIGHSFFICKDDKKPLEKVQETFYKNIIPLLQEYFYGDYGKIGLVLGKGFIRKKGRAENSIFANFEDYDSNFDDRIVYEIIDYRTNNETDTFENALKILMK
jgi:5-methylcytosine-specific restriction endonuclease McrBC GTP-binding regulatory subunit McrB